MERFSREQPLEVSVSQLGNPASGNLPPSTLNICHLRTKAAARKIRNVKMRHEFVAAVSLRRSGEGINAQSRAVLAPATWVPGSHLGGNWTGPLGSGRQACSVPTPGTVLYQFADAPFWVGRSVLLLAGCGLLHEKIFCSIGVFARRSVVGKSNPW